MEQIIMNIFAGHLAGWLCALGGALKDSPHEGFKPFTFPRSIVVGTIGGIISIWLTNNFFLAFALAGYFERAAVEGWKIIRRKKPGKFDWHSEHLDSYAIEVRPKNETFINQDLEGEKI